VIAAGKDVQRAPVDGMQQGGRLGALDGVLVFRFAACEIDDVDFAVVAASERDT